MTKVELLGIYQTALNNCKLAYASIVLWSHEDMPDAFEALYFKLDIPKPYVDLMELLRNRNALKIASENLYDSAHRAALNELLGLTKAYCQATGQLETLKRQAWFQIWNIVRNCFSHNMRFNFNSNEFKQLPVTWDGVTIEASMNGQHLTHGTLSREKLFELLIAGKDFVAISLR